MLKSTGVLIGILTLLAIAASIIIATFWILKRFILPLVKRRKTVQLMETWILRLEVLSWFAFIMFAIYRLLLHNLPMTLVFLGLFILGGMSFWKDFFIGLLYRLERKIKKGDGVTFEQLEGKVQHLGARSLQLELEQGETIFIPYRKLANSLIKKSRLEGHLIRNSFELKLPTALQKNDAQRLKRWILESPWYLPAHPPIIQQQEPGAFLITTFTTTDETAEKLESLLANHISSEKAKKPADPKAKD